MFSTLFLAALLAQTATAPKPAAPKPAAQKPASPAAKTPAKTATPAAKAAAPAAKTTTPAKKAAPVTAPPKTSAKPLESDDDKTLYALGMSIQRSLGPFNLTTDELEIVKRGLTDAAQQKPEVDITVYGPRIQTLVQTRQAQAVEREKAIAADFLAKAAAQPGAEKTDSGLVIRIVQSSLGQSPTASDRVKVHYRGTLTDGTEFDSSYKRGNPATFPLNGVIPCWTEGVQKMKVGEKAILTCPSDLAYGNNGTGSIPGGATLTFEIELLEINPQI
jgi:FKBP-type peptidyl-prolyl cis-trans isomerase FkpA